MACFRIMASTSAQRWQYLIFHNELLRSSLSRTHPDSRSILCFFSRFQLQCVQGVFFSCPTCPGSMRGKIYASRSSSIAGIDDGLVLGCWCISSSDTPQRIQGPRDSMWYGCNWWMTEVLLLPVNIASRRRVWKMFFSFWVVLCLLFGRSRVKAAVQKRFSWLMIHGIQPQTVKTQRAPDEFVLEKRNVSIFPTCDWIKLHHFAGPMESMRKSKR